ncbi:hypothetical protein ACLB2K_032227 [Fragaria x ananassa]
MPSRRLLSPLLRSPAKFPISNYNPTLSTPSQSPLRDAFLSGHRMLHAASSINTNSQVPALLGHIPSSVQYQATTATYLGGFRPPSISSLLPKLLMCLLSNRLLLLELRSCCCNSIQCCNCFPAFAPVLDTLFSVNLYYLIQVQVVDFLDPYQRRGNIGLFGGASVGKNYAYYSAQPGGGGSGGFRKGWRKGRMHGLSCRGNRVSFGKYGLQALEPAWITARQLEAGRRAMSRNARGGGKIWVRVITDKPVTAKPTEVRMGKGKGAVSHRVAVVLPGRILYEVSGVAENVARRAITIAGSKMPIKTKFVVSG